MSELNQSPLDDMFVAMIANQVSLALAAQQAPVDAEQLTELSLGLYNLMTAIEAAKSAGLSNLTKEAIDLRFAQAKLIGMEKQGRTDRGGSSYQTGAG